MIDLGPHAVFIVWGYAGVLAAMAALIAITWWRSRQARARIAMLEAQGIRRRSAGPAS